MEHSVCTYCAATFDGCIYVKIISRTEVASAWVRLIRNGVVVDEKEVPQKFVRFKGNEPGVYKSTAKLTFNDGSVAEIESPEISINEQAVAAKAIPVASTVSQKGGHIFFDNVKNYHLELKLDKGCLEKMENEGTAVIPRYLGLRHRLLLSKISLKAFWQDDSDEEDCDRYLIQCDLANDELLALAQELEKLEYVIYCALVPDTKNLEPPPPLPVEELSIPGEERIEDANIATPNFHHLQNYLNANTPGEAGMNVRAAWNAGETGWQATVRVIDFGIWDQHENLGSNITVVNNRPPTMDRYHGTATTGCIVASNRNFGVRGIAHDCAYFFMKPTISV